MHRAKDNMHVPLTFKMLIVVLHAWSWEGAHLLNLACILHVHVQIEQDWFIFHSADIEESSS